MFKRLFLWIILHIFICHWQISVVIFRDTSVTWRHSLDLSCNAVPLYDCIMQTRQKKSHHWQCHTTVGQWPVLSTLTLTSNRSIPRRDEPHRDPTGHFHSNICRDKTGGSGAAVIIYTRCLQPCSWRATILQISAPTPIKQTWTS